MAISEKTTAELRIQLANCRRILASDPHNVKAQVLAKTISITLAARPGARRKDWETLEWNPDTIKRALKPFVKLTETVLYNSRTSFTEAGGAKLRGEAWIETYTSVKANGVNRLFIALVAKQGDDPIFLIPSDQAGRPNSTIAEMIENCDYTFTADQLDVAQEIWAKVICMAGGR